MHESAPIRQGSFPVAEAGPAHLAPAVSSRAYQLELLSISEVACMHCSCLSKYYPAYIATLRELLCQLRIASVPLSARNGLWKISSPSKLVAAADEEGRHRHDAAVSQTLTCAPLWSLRA